MQQLTGLPQTWTGYGPEYTNCSGAGSFVGEIWVGSGSCTVTPTLRSNWRLLPCTTERTFDSGIGFDPGDIAPGGGNWLLGHGGDRSVTSWDSSDTPMTSFNGTSPAQMSYTWNYSADGSGCTLPPGNEILPLTADLSAVTNRLYSLNAFGSTAGALGTFGRNTCCRRNGVQSGLAQKGPAVMATRKRNSRTARQSCARWQS